MGASAYYGIINADSAFVPSGFGTSYTQAGVNKINFFSIGPGIGYAYTWALSEHFFITGLLIGIAEVNVCKEENVSGETSKIKILPGGVYKVAVGYNSNKWTLCATLLGNALYVASTYSYKEYFVPTGVVNFVLAKKITFK